MSDKLFGWNDEMTFGKYKGERVEDVASRNASYLIWANNNVDFFNLDFQVLKVVEVGEIYDIYTKIK